MAHSLSAKKRLRQNAKSNVQNKGVRSEIKTWTKKVESAVEGKDKALAEQYFNIAQGKLDKSLKRGVYHRNTVARKKAKLAHCVATLA